MNIEACHRLPVRPNAANVGKRVIVKFVNLTHAESILSKQFTRSSRDFSRFNMNNLYVNTSYVYVIVTYGDCVKICNKRR